MLRSSRISQRNLTGRSFARGLPVNQAVLSFEIVLPLVISALLLPFLCFGPKIPLHEFMWRRRLTTAFLIAAWLLTADLFCLIPGVQMTVQEHDCCEKMGGDCGRIPMPDMHTCCRSATPPHAVLIARTDYPELRLMTLPAVIPDLDLLEGTVHARSWLRLDSPTSPPLISHDSFDILRI